MQQFNNTAINESANTDCKYFNECYLQVRNNGYCFSKCEDFHPQPYKDDIWINLFLFFLVTDKPETVLNLIQSDNCEEEFMDMVQRIVTMDSKQLQRKCVDWLMKHREKLMELNKVYKTSQKEFERGDEGGSEEHENL